MAPKDGISEEPCPEEDGHRASNPSPPTTVQVPDRLFGGQISSSPSANQPDAADDHLVYSFGQLSVCKDLPMAERMFSSLEVVFQHAFETSDLDSELDLREWHSRLRRAEENSRRGIRDIGILRWIRDVLDQLRLLDSEDLTQAANILANGSRDASWRLPFGQSGLLEFFLSVVADANTEDDLKTPALRFVGNTCVDTDVNREKAISPDYLDSMIRQLQISELAPITISVIYNICNDYERAQHAFRTHGLFSSLISLLATPFEAGPLLPYICTLLDISTQQYDLSDIPSHSLQTSMQLLQEPDLDPNNSVLIIRVINALLQKEQFLHEIVEEDLVNVLLDVLVSSYEYDAQDSDTEEDAAVLRNVISQTLSDISATNLFARHYAIDSALVRTLIQWLSSSHEQLRISSCLVLGNLARSDSVCLEMVQRLSLHEKLLELLDNQSNMQVAYAALGFLRNLALPAENKTVIGTQQSMEIISTFWSLDFNPQVQHGSVALLRQLLNNCIGNVRWLLESLSLDPDSPAHEKTFLSLLLLLFGRTDDVSTKVEIGRTVATICRCIASSSQGLPPESTGAILHRLYGTHADIARPLAMMVSQSRFPVIRSEGWFALALMARSREGTAAVSEALQQMEVFGALVATITGQPTNGQHNNTPERPQTSNTRLSGGSSSSSDTRSEQEREMQAKDRENALVLVNELLKNTGDESSVIRRSILEDLMRGPQSQEGAQELMTRAQSEDRTE